MKWFHHDTDMHRNRKIRKLIRSHGATGYAFWCVLLEKLYEHEDGFQICADELWFEDIAEDLKLGDYRTPIRILDTLAALGLIDNQLWQEHIISSSAIIERGDSYVIKRAQEAEKKRRYRANLKRVSTVDSLGTEGQCPQMSPPDPNAESESNSESNSENISSVCDISNAHAREADRSTEFQESDRPHSQIPTLPISEPDPPPQSPQPAPESNPVLSAGSDRIGEGQYSGAAAQPETLMQLLMTPITPAEFVHPAAAMEARFKPSAHPWQKAGEAVLEQFLGYLTSAYQRRDEPAQKAQSIAVQVIRKANRETPGQDSYDRVLAQWMLFRQTSATGAVVPEDPQTRNQKLLQRIRHDLNRN